MKRIIDGVTYIAKPAPFLTQDVSACHGCAGRRDKVLCHKLPNCFSDNEMGVSVVFVVQPKE